MTFNPFYDHYLAESLSAEEYVTLFSPVLIPHIGELFAPVNVVVVGMQGCGKSMLLDLLKPETRLMYAEVGEQFPVPKQLRKFISCNVNLTTSSAKAFGIRDWSNQPQAEVEMMFGDFLNSLLVCDLIDTLKSLLNSNSGKILEEVGLIGSFKELDAAAESISKMNCWHGWLNGCDSIESLHAALNERSRLYEDYLHLREKKLPEKLLKTRSFIGEPISQIVKIFRECDVIADDTKVFVDIDQYEELNNITINRENIDPIDYRSVINRGIGSRSSEIFYRVGSRRHSWRKYTKMMGSDGRIEENRDYKYVDLDLLLERRENRRTYIFPKFAEDVFKRRLRGAKYKFDTDNALEAVYGKSFSASEKAVKYQPNNPLKTINLERSWSKPSVDRLKKLAVKKPLSARLGEAWLRQKGDHFDHSLRDSELPWERQQYWKKERVELALMQIASRNQQRPIYSGVDEICDLSGGNILTFVSINHHIWNEYVKFLQVSGRQEHGLPTIGVDLQSGGVFEASRRAFEKISEESGRSNERTRFLKEAARVMRQKVMADKNLSYPGANGFSIKDSELDEVPKLKEFLEELADYGNLSMTDHTTKEKNRAARSKFYINQIMCPQFRITYKHVKEPYYTTSRELLKWAQDVGVHLLGRPKEKFVDVEIEQIKLFEE